MGPVPCLCPPTPEGTTRHPDGDTVTFKERLDFRTAATIQHAVSAFRLARGDDEVAVEEVLATLTEAYLRYGIASWTLVDKEGKPIPVTPSNVETYLLVDIATAAVLGDEADSAFSEAILLPLLRRASSSSPDMQTPESTSPPTGSQPSTPTPLKPSLITTSQTVVTETTSDLPDGDSSSSPRSESVA